MEAAIPPPARPYMFCVQGQLYIYVQEMEGYTMHIYIYIYIYILNKNSSHSFGMELGPVAVCPE